MSFSIFGGSDKKRKNQSSLDQLSQESQELLAPYDDNKERYTPVGYLGEGGFGKVMCCFDNNLNRAAAIKTLHSKFRDNQHQIQAALNEIRLISYLNHPGVVSIYDAFLGAEGDFTYSMELIQGEDLEDLLYKLEENFENLPLVQCIKIFTKLSETLAYVHDMGVIHLDLKPSNIMLGQYGEVQILDWGAAHLYAPKRYEDFIKRYKKDAKMEDIFHDRSGGIEGTIPFMSPEQTERPRHQLTPASDIFSVGISLYRALTGRFPFCYDSLESFLYDLNNLEPPPLHEVRGDIPIRMSQICSKMLAKRTEDRYQSFHEVLHDLESLANSGQVFEQKSYQKGEILVHEGERGEYAFQIIDGMVEVFVMVDGTKKSLAVRGSGSILGEVAVFTKEPRSASIVALETTTVKLLNQQMVVEELEKLNPWVGHMVYQLSQRFIEQNQRILSLKEKLTSDQAAATTDESTSSPSTKHSLTTLEYASPPGTTSEQKLRWKAFHPPTAEEVSKAKNNLTLAKNAPKSRAFTTEEWNHLQAKRPSQDEAKEKETAEDSSSSSSRWVKAGD